MLEAEVYKACRSSFLCFSCEGTALGLKVIYRALREGRGQGLAKACHNRLEIRKNRRGALRPSPTPALFPS